MIKRTFQIVTVTVLASLAVGLLAFGPRAIDNLPKDRIVVDYWEKWTGQEESVMRGIVDDFNTSVGAQKGIFVRYLSTASITQKTLISTAAGVPPDIAGLWDQNVAQFAAQDALEPLDDLAAEHGITSETYKKVFWDGCHYDGKLYALISTPYNVALYYNNDVFQRHADDLRKAGLDPNRGPQTLAELDAYAVALDRKGANGIIDRAGFLPMEPGWYMNYMPFWFGGQWWDETTERFTFTDPKVVATFDWIGGYSKRLGKAAMSDFRSGFGNFDSPQNAFLTETVVMEQHGTFFANFIKNNKPSMANSWKAIPFPSADPSLVDVTYCNFDVFVIPRGSKRKREAFEFIAYVNRQDVMEKLTSLHCKISPLRKVSEEYLNTHRNKDIRVFERLANSPNAHGSPPIPILPQVVEELNNFTQQLILQQTTATEGLAGVQERLQRKYEDFKDKQRRRRESQVSQ